MRRSTFLKTLCVTALIILFRIAFSLNEITASSGADLATGGGNAVRKITNEYSELPQFAKLDESITQFLKRWEIVGASVAIVNRGKLVYAKGFGFADTVAKITVEPEHLFRIASVSKLITAVTILKMEEFGLLSLNDRVFGPNGILTDSIYLGYRDKNVEKITIRHLLEHSGGWTTRSGDPMFMHWRLSTLMNKPLPLSSNDIIQYVLTRHRLSFMPGTRSVYSNLGYVILGEVIAKVSGMPYEQYVREKILAPMGIYNMRIGRNFYEMRYPGETVYFDRRGAEYRLSCDGTGQMVPRQYGGTDIEALGAAGGWVASAVDLMKFMTHIDGYTGVIDFLDPYSIEKMTCPAEPYLSPIGWRETHGDGVWWRTGTLAGSSALMVRQNDGVSWVVLMNTSTWKGSRFSPDIYRMMVKALATVDEWPNVDLFNLRLPENAKPISPAWWAAGIYKH